MNECRVYEVFMQVGAGKALDLNKLHHTIGWVVG
jgi:hypothetical protein